MRISLKPNRTAYLLITLVLIGLGWFAYIKRKELKRIVMGTINYLKEKTWDIASDRRIESLHPLIKAKAKEFIIRAEKELGIKLRVTSAFRSVKEQEVLYQNYLKGGVLAAPPFESYHNYGLAIDVVEIKNGKAMWNNPNWDTIGAFGERLGFTWGGRWKGKKNDKPHFQMTFGLHHSQLAVIYKSGKREGEYVNIA